MLCCAEEIASMRLLVNTRTVAKDWAEWVARRGIGWNHLAALARLQRRRSVLHYKTTKGAHGEAEIFGAFVG